MSTAHLPPAEPPADDVHQVLELLDAARLYLRDAERMAAMLEMAEDDVEQLGPVAQLYRRTELAAAGIRVDLWRAEVDALMDRAQLMGLRP